MKSWKKQLTDEFERAAPALREDVKNAPIITDVPSDIQNGSVLVKRRIGLISSCAAALIAIVFALLGICGVFGNGAPLSVDKFVFTVEINPAVSFITDVAGKVQGVASLNADADVILSDESMLNRCKNAAISEAVIAYTDCAIRLGYLDISQSATAVRLCSSEETDKSLLDDASDKLSGYFRTNGIYAVVVEEIIPAAELGEMLGISGAENIGGLTDEMLNRPVLYGKRMDENAGEEELKSLYESYIVGTQLKEYVQEELLGNIEKIVSSAKMLSEIGLCNYHVMLHKDNPCGFIADYWTVKKYSDGEYGGEFAQLMSEMKGLLDEYEREFGVRIGGISELIAAADIYQSFSGIDFSDLFLSLSADEFLASASKYVGMLKNIGYDTSALETLLSVPKTVDEYFSKMQTALEQSFKAREEKFREIYDCKRDEISEEEYGGFVDGIIKKYGSLENFWNKNQ